MMKLALYRAFLGLGLSFCLTALASAQDAKLELKAPKGHSAEYTVKETTTSDFGGGTRASESEITYLIEVAEKKDNGDAVVKVTYKSVKAKQEGGDATWEFDSAKKEGGDEVATQLRQTIASPITIHVSGGKITEISGIAEPQRQEGGQGFRGMRAGRIAGRAAIERHVGMILASPAHNQKLEKGKEYKQEGRRQEASGDGERRGRRFGRDNFLLAYKFEGEEKARNAPAAKFKLSAFRQPAGADAPEVRGELKSEGKSLVSLEDGLLIELDLTTDSKTEFERDGETRSFTSKSKITVERKSGGAKEVRTASL
jgi:hypothetical protein